MTSGGDVHSALIAKAAKTHLGAIGFGRKGQSRLWFKDNRWWLGVVEFLPSSWSKGSYLNVAAMWLWNAKDYWTFDDGGRVETFREFKNSDQFALAAEELASRAKDEMLALCQRFQSISSVASHLAGKSDENPWHSYHAAMAALAAGEQSYAQARFDALLAAREHAPWVSDLRTKVLGLIKRLDETTTPLDVITQEVGQARTLLKLSPVDATSVWGAAV